MKKPILRKRPAPRIGIWAGSSPSQKSFVKLGLVRLQKLSLEAVMPAGVRKNATRAESKARAFLAGPDRQKIESFLKLWRDPKISDILCVRGGYGSLRLIRFLEKLPLKKTSKRIWGFSDLTSLQNYLYFRLGAPWVHSPMLTSESFHDPRGVEKDFWSPDATVSSFELKTLSAPSGIPSLVRAPIIGGNLACFAALCGLPALAQLKKPFFLFLEDLNEKPYRVDRWLVQIANSGLLKNCRGVLLGHWTNCENSVEIIRLWANENNLYLASGIPAGHDRPNVPLSMGVPVALSLSKKSSKALLRVPISKLGC